MALDLERVDLNPFSWSSLIYTINGQEIFGCTGLSYGWKRERTDGYGMGRSHAPRAITAGKVSFEPLKVKLYADSVEAVRDYYALFSPDRRSFTEPRLNHSIQYVESETFNDKHLLFEGAMWVTETGSHDEGPDPLVVEVEFKIMRLWINGKTPWNNSRQ
jgi:hypothetical protein